MVAEPGAQPVSSRVSRIKNRKNLGVENIVSSFSDGDRGFL
jgi:hypothetical protein